MQGIQMVVFYKMLTFMQSIIVELVGYSISQTLYV